MALTVADIIKLKDETLGGVVEEVQKKTPLIDNLEAEATTGISANIPVVTALPAGEFRADNTGKSNNSATIVTRPIALKYFDASWILDEKVAKADTRGTEAAIEFAASMAIKGALKGLESQVIYGDADVSGFDGLLSMLADLSAGVEIDAGGELVDSQTSVWALNTDAIKLVVGNDGELAQGDIMHQLVTDADGKGYWAYVQAMSVYAALKAVDSTGFGRIGGLDTTATLTDEMIYDLIGSLDDVNLIVMNRQSMKQLRSSRTATNATGASAPFVTEIEGIPVIVTDSIVSTEAVIAS